MSRFEPELRRLDADLRTPEPQRTRVLLEIAHDLEGAYATYRRRGLNEAEARQRAAALLAVAPAVAHELTALHAAPGTRWLLRRLSGRSGGDRLILTVLTCVTVAASAPALMGALQSSAVVPAVVLGLGAVMVWNALGVLLSLIGIARPDVARMTERLERLPFLSALVFVATALCALLLLLSDSSDATHAPAAIARAAEAITLGLSVALLGLLGWFHLSSRIAAVSLLRAELDEVIHHHEEVA